MGKAWSALRTKVGLAAVGGALLLTGVGVGAGVAMSSPGTQTTSDVSAVTSDSATATSGTAATSTTASAPATTPPAATSSAPAAVTVAPVTSSPQTTDSQPEGQQPDLAPGQDPQGVGTIGPDGRYTPAPGPDVLPMPQAPPVPKLPGETGYTAGATSTAP